METTNSHLCATSFSKPQEAFVKESRGRGFCQDSTYELRSLVIHAYLQVLEDMRGSIAVDSQLPYPKEHIAQAILCELADTQEADLRLRLEIAYVLLESFIPYEEYRVIQDFKIASLCAEQNAEVGNPTSILRSARIIRTAKGDRAVRLQEKIYGKMRARQRQVHELGKSSAA